MRNIFIPRGSIIFPGGHSQLLQTVNRENGVLDKPDQFHCRISFPSQQFRDARPLIRIRGSISHTFRCTFEDHAHGQKINYKVYPGFFSVFILIAAIASICSSFLGLSNGDDQQKFLGIIVAILLILLVYLARAVCIKTFIKISQEKAEAFLS